MSETITLENLRRIFNSMNEIKEIDRSDYFQSYY
jgi:hypothetical protein